MTGSRAPVLVTGLPRSGTSWVGKMLEASGDVVYVNEPLNPSHPPGRSPGVLDAQVEHYFQYICPDNEWPWVRAYADTVALRYHPVRELRANRDPYDVARAAKYTAAFTAGRLRRRAALLDDPYATMSVAWFADRLGTRAVVLVRDPVAFVGSWRALGWTVDPAELLAQPLLMRDHLEPLREDLERLAGSPDWLATSCVLWRAAYTVVSAVTATRRHVLVRRHEDLAADPVEAFRSLYADLGLRWHDAARAHVQKATSAGSATPTGFRWSLKGGLSRTAFQPMDSRAALGSYRTRLREDEIGRVLDLTEDVRSRYYAESPV
ncbi:MAG: sulfotransferase [Actinomycetota bacterium]|nr:sulfotransferase [Actinomycetota bacterium]